MDCLLVTRFGFGDRGRHHLSFVDPCVDLESSPVVRELDLPMFDKDESVGCGVSCLMLYIVGRNGKIFVIDLVIGHIRALPPLDFEPSPPHQAMLTACCLGRDSRSKKYMMIVHYIQYYMESYYEGGELSYAGSESRYRLHTFEDVYAPGDSWVDIPTPYSDSVLINEGFGVFMELTGCCYWIAMESNPNFRNVVLSFDFASQNFDKFDLPEPRMECDFRSSLVECRGSLVAILFWKSRSAMTFEIYIRNETLWDLSHTVSLSDVNRPMGLFQGDLLALEAQDTSGSAQLVFYDLGSNNLMKLNMYDQPNLMSVHGLSLPENLIQLPDVVWVDDLYSGSQEIPFISYD